MGGTERLAGGAGTILMGQEEHRQNPDGPSFLRPLANRRVLVAALLCVLGLAACGGGSETETSPELPTEFGDGPAAELDEAQPLLAAVEVSSDAPLVVFLGDSISAGLHLPSEQAFPAVLQRELFARGLPFRLINAGVSGDTTSGGLARTDWVLRQEPDVLVIELGANDGLRGIGVETMESNLREMVAKAREAGSQVLLLGVLIPPSYGAEYSDAIRDLYPALAAELELAFVPFFMEGVAGVPELTLPDGLHPTAEGHRLMAENVEEALAELLTPE